MPWIELIGSVIFGISSTQGLKFSFFVSRSHQTVGKLSLELGGFDIFFFCSLNLY